MSQSSALAKARGLREALHDHGVPEVSIELQAGRPNPYDPWDSLKVVTNFAHHIVSRYSPSNLTPGLALVKRGRPNDNLPGPLCNGHGGFDLCARIICMGYANHPGAGGPLRVGNFVIPKDSARRYAFGWEFEGGLNKADWDRVLRNPRGKGRPMTMHEFMARCGAGVQDFYGLPATAHVEHKTWAPTRKVDRLGYTQSSGIAAIRKFGGLMKPPATPTQEEDMPLNQTDLEAIRKIVETELNKQDGQLWSTEGGTGKELVIERLARIEAVQKDHTNRLIRIEDDTDGAATAPK